MRIDILTIFPNFFAGFLDHGIASRALREQRVDVRTSDLRDFTTDRHRTVDDRPFGGGEGMVLKPEPIGKAMDALQIASKADRDATRETVILLSPQGRPFKQHIAQKLASLDRIVMICGRYEGVDERVNTIFCDRELSIGDYILSGGELAASVIMDAVIRLLPGAVGNADSVRHESFTAPSPAPLPQAQLNAPATVFASAGLLDYPHYTRPAEYMGHSVPDALNGGDHAAVRRWRRQMSLHKTWQNRPDLLHHAQLRKEDLDYLAQLGWSPSAAKTTPDQA